MLDIPLVTRIDQSLSDALDQAGTTLGLAQQHRTPSEVMTPPPKVASTARRPRPDRVACSAVQSGIGEVRLIPVLIDCFRGNYSGFAFFVRAISALASSAYPSPVSNDSSNGPPRGRSGDAAGGRRKVGASVGTPQSAIIDELAEGRSHVLIATGLFPPEVEIRVEPDKMAPNFRSTAGNSAYQNARGNVMSLPLMIVGIIGGIACVVGIVLRVLAGTGTRWGDLGERLVPGGAAIGLPAIFEYLPLLLGVRQEVFEQTSGWVFGVLWICSVTGAIFVGLNIRAYARPRHESQ